MPPPPPPPHTLPLLKVTPPSFACRADGGGVYTLVQPYPRRKYGLLEEELGQSLLALGLNPRSLLLMEPRAEAAGGGGLGRAVGAGAKQT